MIYLDRMNYIDNNDVSDNIVDYSPANIRIINDLARRIIQVRWAVVPIAI